MSSGPLSHGMDLPLQEGSPDHPQTNGEPDTIWRAPSSARTAAASVDTVADTTAVSSEETNSEETSVEPKISSTPSPTTPPSKLSVLVTHDEVGPKRPSIWVWRMEIALCSLSLASFSVIIAVLRVYDGTKLVALPLDITLNAYLSFFTTLSKAAFMVPVAEAMSQWKWNMYGSNGPTGRPMSDFNTLEQASRGTLGSFRLLLRYRWKHITVVGALVSIMGIATSPVTQQMISYPVQPSPNLNLEGTQIGAPVARGFTQASNGDDGTNHLSPIWAAIVATLGSSIRYPVEDFHPPCPTGNCTFATYNSLAVCTKVVDITDQLTVTKIANSSSSQWTDNLDGWRDDLAPNGTMAYNASLPNGHNLITPVAYSFVQQMGGVNDTLAFKDQPDLFNFTALIHAYLIYSAAGNVSYPGHDQTNETDWSFRAVEVLYHMCVNTYQTIVTSGETSTTVLASSYAPLRMENNLPLVTHGCLVAPEVFGVVKCDLDYLTIPGYTYLADPDDPAGLHPENNFTIERSTAVFLGEHLFQIAAFQTVMYDGGTNSLKYSDGNSADSIFEALYGYWYNVSDPNEQISRISQSANFMAIAINNLMRSSEDNTLAEGIAWTLEPFIHVRWGFTAFFAAQLLFSYVFLAATIFLTRRGHLPVVKSSGLAAILASSEEMRNKVGTIDEIQEAEKRAGGVRIRLEGGRFEIV